MKRIQPLIRFKLRFLAIMPPVLLWLTEDAISDASDYISNLEEGLIQEEAYYTLILMLEDSNNSNAELQVLLETSNNTILELQNSLAENQSFCLKRFNHSGFSFRLGFYKCNSRFVFTRMGLN